MDDELKDFEAELRRLEPARPSAALADRIGRALATVAPSMPRATIRWVWFAAAPAAAALALLLSRPEIPASARSHPLAAVEPSANASELLKPVAAENILYGARDEGVVLLEDGTPARRERLQFVDTITWKNPRTNASLRWIVPREEVRVVPISFQ